MDPKWVQLFTRYLKADFLPRVHGASQQYKSDQGCVWYIQGNVPSVLSERFILYANDTHLYEYNRFARASFGSDELAEADAIYETLDGRTSLSFDDEFEVHVRSTRATKQQRLYIRYGVVLSFEVFGRVFERWLKDLVRTIEHTFWKQWGVIPSADQTTQYYVPLRSMLDNGHILFILSDLWDPSQVVELTSMGNVVHDWYPHCTRHGDDDDENDNDSDDHDKSQNLACIDISDIDQWDPLVLADHNQSYSRKKHSRRSTMKKKIGIDTKWWKCLSLDLRKRIEDDRYEAGYTT
jgi:hypothetical protein